MVTQTYDVHELLIQVPNFENAPSLMLANNPPAVKPAKGSSEARLKELHRERARHVTDLNSFQANLNSIEKDVKAGIDPPAFDQVVSLDPQVQERQIEKEKLVNELEMLQTRLGENHPIVKKVQQEVEDCTKKLKAEEVLARTKTPSLVLNSYRQNIAGTRENINLIDAEIEKITQEMGREQQRNSKNKNLPTAGLLTPAPPSDIDQTVQEPSSIKTGPNGETSIHTSPRKNASASEIDGFIAILKSTVDPKSWQTGATIRQLAGQLFILQTPANHEAIHRLLNTLHEDRKMQIVVESRLVQLKDPPAASSIPGSLRAKLDAYSQGEQLANGILLEKAEIDELLSFPVITTSAETAPRLTLFTGQRAYIAKVRQRSYIADYTVVYAKDGGPLFNPRIETVSSGFLVDVQAAASIDRKSISLSIRDQFSTLESLIDKPFDGGPKDQKLSIQQPILSLSQVLVNTNIGDGRTMLFRFEDSSRSDFPGATTKPVATTRPSGRQYLLVKASIVRQQGPATQGE